jgi:hypothetical protein
VNDAVEITAMVAISQQLDAAEKYSVGWQKNV